MMRPILRSRLRAPLGPGKARCRRYRAGLTGSDRLVLAAVRGIPDLAVRRGPGAGQRQGTAGQRIGWQAHTVAKRCENIRARYARLGVPGLGGPRALEQLALLLVFTGGLTAADLRLLPARTRPR